MSAFVNPQSRLCVVIATVAFSMGVDCPCVREIIHWGPSDDIDMYVQEIGHAGQDGELAVTKRFWPSSDQQNGTECLQEKLLYADFEDSSLVALPLPKCRCCDVCNSSCECGSCI